VFCDTKVHYETSNFSFIGVDSGFGVSFMHHRSPKFTRKPESTQENYVAVHGRYVGGATEVSGASWALRAALPQARLARARRCGGRKLGDAEGGS
jgi:hypothetical protein